MAYLKFLPTFSLNYLLSWLLNFWCPFKFWAGIQCFPWLGVIVVWILMFNLQVVAAQLIKNPPAMQETVVQLLGWEDPLEKGQVPTPVSLPGKFHGQRSLVGYMGSQTVKHNWATFTFNSMSWYIIYREICSVVSDSLQLHELYSPWNFLGQNTGVGSLSPSPGDLPNLGIKPRSPTLQEDSLPAEPPGKPNRYQ